MAEEPTHKKISVAVASALIPAAIIGLALYFGGWGGVFAVLGKIWSGISSFLAWLGGVLGAKVQVPVWILVVAAGIIWTMPRLIIRWRKTKHLKPIVDVKEYTEDIFIGVKWRWEWRGNVLQTGSVASYCPHDDMRLQPHLQQDWDGNTETVYKCLHCGKEWGPTRGDDRYIARLIIEYALRKIRTGEWEKEQKLFTEKT